MQNKMEILSPAGNLETLKAAVSNGADAVYVGGKNFSARKNAVNFSNEELIEAVEFAHLHGAKVYVTFNTLIHDSELCEAFEFAKFLYTIGVDAVIVQDLGLVHLIKKYFPDMEIHASTQMTLHNADGVRTIEKLGFKRVVLSRELSFDEIKSIKEKTDAELEVFVHGALCMSYSGQCLMSSFLGCRSGNRGACAQPCRLPYTVLDSNGKVICKDKYPLSLKDLCLVDEMAKLKECGVTSLKIEGRMKSAEYVCAVTSIYDKYRDGGKVSDGDMHILKNIFSRSGFTKGYLYRKYGRDMLNFNKNNDDVYTSVDKEVLDFAKKLKDKIPQKIDADVSIEIKLGDVIKAEFSSCGRTVSVNGAIPSEKALNTPLSEERISEQIKKTGSTPFEVKNVRIVCDDGVSLPVKEINSVRREGFELLEKAISESSKTTDAVYIKEKDVKANYGKISAVAEVLTLKQAEASLKSGFDKVLAPYKLYSENKKYFDSIKEKVAVILPAIERDIHREEMSIDVNEVYVSSVSQFERFSDKKITANYTLNAFNSLALRTLSLLGANRVCLSSELNVRQLSAIDDFLEKEIIVYGRIPLMTVQNCVIKSTNGSCMCDGGFYTLKDRKGAEFPLISDKGRCTNTIYNSKPLYMADKLNEIPTSGVSSHRFIFTIETEEEIKKIAESYKNGAESSEDFTRGHFFRGV